MRTSEYPIFISTVKETNSFNKIYSDGSFFEIAQSNYCKFKIQKIKEINFNTEEELEDFCNNL